MDGNDVVIGTADDTVLSVEVENKIGSDISQVSVKRHSDSSFPSPLAMSGTWSNDQNAQIYIAGVSKTKSTSKSTQGQNDDKSVYDLAGANAVTFDTQSSAQSGTSANSSGTNTSSNGTNTSSSVGLSYTVGGDGSTSTSKSADGSAQVSSSNTFDIQITTSDGAEYEVDQVAFEHMRDAEIHLSDYGVAYITYIDTTTNRSVSTLPQSAPQQTTNTQSQGASAQNTTSTGSSYAQSAPQSSYAPSQTGTQSVPQSTYGQSTAGSGSVPSGSSGAGQNSASATGQGTTQPQTSAPSSSYTGSTSSSASTGQGSAGAVQGTGASGTLG